MTVKIRNKKMKGIRSSLRITDNFKDNIPASLMNFNNTNEKIQDLMR